MSREFGRNFGFAAKPVYRPRLVPFLVAGALWLATIVAGAKIAGAF